VDAAVAEEHCDGAKIQTGFFFNQNDGKERLVQWGSALK